MWSTVPYSFAQRVGIKREAVAGTHMAARSTRDITGAFWAFVRIMSTPCRGAQHDVGDVGDDDGDVRDVGDDDGDDGGALRIDDHVFVSDAYREMCAAVHSHSALIIGTPYEDASSSSNYPAVVLVFDDVSALFRGAEELARAFPSPGRAEQLARCFNRVQAWIDAEELSSLFSVGASM